MTCEFSGQDTYSFLDENPCTSKLCNVSNSKCKRKGKDDYICDCLDGYRHKPDSDDKICEGIHYKTHAHINQLSIVY